MGLWLSGNTVSRASHTFWPHNYVPTRCLEKMARASVSVVAAQADVQERPIVHAHRAADLRRHERVLLLLQRDGQGVAHDAPLNLVNGGELQQAVTARRLSQLQPVDAGHAWRLQCSLERAAMKLDSVLAWLRAVDVLHAAARGHAGERGGRAVYYTYIYSWKR